jgi:hypothetical protein
LKPSSAKAKGRAAQQYIRDKILELFPSLTELDVRSTSMGAGGEDIQMSTAAKALFPYKIESKHLAAMAIYGIYDQACSHKGIGEPLLVVRQNRSKPLAVVDFDYFLSLHKPKADK